MTSSDMAVGAGAAGEGSRFPWAPGSWEDRCVPRGDIIEKLHQGVTVLGEEFHRDALSAAMLEAAEEIKSLRCDIACRGLPLEYRIRENLGFSKLYSLSCLPDDVAELRRQHGMLLSALKAMLNTHGKPMREEWINERGLRHAQDVDALAREAIERADAGKWPAAITKATTP